VPQDWIADHAVNQHLIDLADAVEAARTRWIEDGEPVENDGTIERSFALGLYLHNLLPQADRELTLRTAIAEIDSSVSEMARLFNTFAGDGNVGHLSNAKNHLRTALTAIPLIRFPATTIDADATREALESAASDFRVQLESTAGQAGELAASLEALSERLDLSTVAATRVEEQVDDAASALAEATKAALEKVEAAGQAALEATQPQLEAAISAFTATSEAAITASEGQWLSAVATVEDKAEEHLSKLETLKDQAVSLVGLIGRTGMTAGYQADANAEDRQYRLWRTGAVLLGLLAVVFLASAVGAPADGAVETVATRLGVSAAVGGLATYAAAQAGGHRQAARHSRNLELAIASLGPYLEDIEDKDDLLQAFAFIFFTPASTERMKGSSDAVTVRHQVMDLVKDLLSKRSAK